MVVEFYVDELADDLYEGEQPDDRWDNADHEEGIHVFFQNLNFSVELDAF